MSFDTEHDLYLKIDTLKSWKTELSIQMHEREFEAKRIRDEALSLDLKREILASLYDAADADSPERKALYSILNPLVDEFHKKATEAVNMDKELESTKITFKLIEDRINSELANLDLDEED